MRSPMTRRLSSVAGAFALAMGGSAVAIAAGGPDLPEQATDQARTAVENAETEEVEDLEHDPAVQNDPEVQNEHAGENAEAFSTWVESLPEDLGCVRGYLVSHAAREDHRGDDFQPPMTEAEARTALEGHPCLGGDGPEPEGGEGARPEDAGPPPHANRPTNAGTAGPPAHAGQGRPGR